MAEHGHSGIHGIVTFFLVVNLTGDYDKINNLRRANENLTGRISNYEQQIGTLNQEMEKYRPMFENYEKQALIKAREQHSRTNELENIASGDKK